MAPEVANADPKTENGYGCEADIWSLGVMLFEFVCGYLAVWTQRHRHTRNPPGSAREELRIPSDIQGPCWKRSHPRHVAERSCAATRLWHRRLRIVEGSRILPAGRRELVR